MQLTLEIEPSSETESQSPCSEEWKVIDQFPMYEASSLGRFRNRYSGAILHGTNNHNGYIHIGLMKNHHQHTKLAHRVIAETFLHKPTPAHSDVNHRNKNRHDNRVSNLEWTTRSYNSRHSKMEIS